MASGPNVDTNGVYRLLAQGQIQSALRLLTAVDAALARSELDLTADGCIQIRNALEKSVAMLEDASFPFSPNHVAFDPLAVAEDTAR